MFEKGAYVIHGSNGVCRVDDIGPLVGMGAGDKEYYTLTPIYTNGGKIFSPVDNLRIVLRPVLTKAEAEQLLAKVGDLEELQITDEKKREEAYKQAFYSGECENLVMMLKAIYSIITRFSHMAEDCLYGELAISFDTSREEAKEMFESRVDTKLKLTEAMKK